MRRFLSRQPGCSTCDLFIHQAHFTDHIVRGILAASRKDFQDLNRFLEEKNIQLSPIIDRVFSFDDAPAAFKYLAEGNHVGKVVIKV